MTRVTSFDGWPAVAMGSIHALLRVARSVGNWIAYR
jgi:hypothetical protein